jgi:hypothetical protein
MAMGLVKGLLGRISIQNWDIMIHFLQASASSIAKQVLAILRMKIPKITTQTSSCVVNLRLKQTGSNLSFLHCQSDIPKPTKARDLPRKFTGTTRVSSVGVRNSCNVLLQPLLVQSASRLPVTLTSPYLPTNQQK